MQEKNKENIHFKTGLIFQYQEENKKAFNEFKLAYEEDKENQLAFIYMIDMELELEHFEESEKLI